MKMCIRDRVKAEWCKKIPLRRGGTPEDVANIATFLASDMSSDVYKRQPISLVSYIELNSKFYPRFSKEDIDVYKRQVEEFGVDNNRA